MSTKFTANFARFLALAALLLGQAAPTGAALAGQPGGSLTPVVTTSEASIIQGLGQDPQASAPVSGADLPASVKNLLKLPKTGSGAADYSADPDYVQIINGGGGLPSTPLASFEGVAANGSLPADPNGDIGYDASTKTKYYMQWVNTKLQIWNVTNPAAPVSLYGPAAGNVALFSSMGGTICETHNDGDPIVVFDHLANRWLASQFAFTTGNYHQCIAVSMSANPTGGWYRYDFLISNTKFNDYPKFGVWPDGYYMSMNQFDTADQWAGAGAVVFERSAMLTGASARALKFDLAQITLDFGNMLPSDLDGPAPAVGTPNYFVEWDDSNWLGDPTDTLRVWNFHVDWTTLGNSTFGLSGQPNVKIATANVDPAFANFGVAISQPGTAQKIDAIPDRLMYRLQYRTFGGYQTLVSNHTVDVNNTDRAGIHWFELRNTGGGWSMRQQGVYSPDGDSRWMGSAAMDTTGNIALGFSISSGTTFPSIRYTAHGVTGALGTMDLGEITLVAGGGSQTHSSGRWGDYSMMSVDPLNDCTFWYTQQYYSTTSSAGWQTRIGAFRVPSCATFADVPVGAFAQNYIEALYNAGVTGGCSTLPRNYCPGGLVTRAQMAVFLLRAKGITPGVPTGTVFTDVPASYWAAGSIETFASLGITSGCSVTPKMFCPEGLVTRDQMAIFLLRAEHGSAYTPPAATGVFADVPVSFWAAPWIEQLASEGITTGCSTSPKLYCPANGVSRDQMAVFLVRTFALPLP